MQKDLILPGMQVQTGDCGWRAKYKNQLCKVVSISTEGRFSEENKGLCVTFVDPPEPADDDVPNPYTCSLESDRGGRFKFACDN